jgi:hypothetical protein
MSNIDTVFSYFDVRDYTNRLTVSSYALPFTPLTFLPRLDKLADFDTGTGITKVDVGVLSRKRMIWDFGDGTNIEAVTARHYFKEPGRYKVTCYLYDKIGGSYYDIYSQTVNIYNYIPDSIILKAANTTNTFLTAGVYTSPINVIRSTSWQYYEIPYVEPVDDSNFFQPPSKAPKLPIQEPSHRQFNLDKLINIMTYISGASASGYFDNNLNSTHYGHLYPYSSIFIKSSSIDNLTEYIEVSSFTTTSTPIYIKLSGTKIVNGKSDDIDSFFCGTTGSQLIYYKDDFPSIRTDILLGVEADTLKPYSNTSTVGFKTTTAKNKNYSQLSITSNGLDSEGTIQGPTKKKLPLLFPIDQNKFSNSKIGIVIKVKDSNNFTIKDIPLINYPSSFTSFKLYNSGGSYNFDIVSDFGSLSSLTKGGFWKGYIIPYTKTPLLNVTLSATVVVEGVSVQGASNTFNIYPSGGIYGIAKRGEDIDFKQTFEDIAIQPLFLDKTILFNEFLGTVFGDIDSIQDSIGKVTYEKIKNFVDNNATLDYSNIDQLISILETINQNEQVFSSTNFNVPKELKRLVDLLSINHSRLFGATNKFSKNFDRFGYFDNELYGKNLGEPVSISYTVTAGRHLVAYEKFSEVYTYLNTYIPLCASNISVGSNNTFSLSSYNDTWGWGLILPSDGYGTNLPVFYNFYTYNPEVDGTIEESVINFSDKNTTLAFSNSSYTEWSKESGIISNIVSQKLYDKLDLFV